MTPKELLNSHRYPEALQALTQEMREQPERNYYGTIGQALLAIGNFNEALKNFRLANEIESQRLE